MPVKNPNIKKEIKLLQNAKKRTKSFGELYDYFLPIIYKYVYYRSGFDTIIAEDLTENIFIKILDHLSSIEVDLERGPKPYFYTVARHALIDYYRENSREKNVNLDSVLSTLKHEDHKFEKMIEAEERHKVSAILQTLSEKEQEIIALRYGSGFKHEEIARVMDMTLDNVSVTLHRLLKKLKLIMEKEGINDGL